MQKKNVFSANVSCDLVRARTLYDAFRNQDLSLREILVAHGREREETCRAR